MSATQKATEILAGWTTTAAGRDAVRSFARRDSVRWAIQCTETVPAAELDAVTDAMMPMLTMRADEHGAYAPTF